jgi:hypothetical protein
MHFTANEWNRTKNGILLIVCVLGKQDVQTFHKEIVNNT